MLGSFSESWIRWWLQTGLRGRDEANNERLVDIDNNDSDEDDTSASKSIPWMPGVFLLASGEVCQSE